MAPRGARRSIHSITQSSVVWEDLEHSKFKIIYEALNPALMIEMRGGSKALATVVAFIAVILLANPATASTEQASSPQALVDLFPHNNMEVPGDSAIILMFSELMDALSVLKSINVTLEAGLSVSVQLSGECGDGSTLLLSPTAGRWQPGNYTVSFTEPLRTANDHLVPSPTLVSRFNVTAGALPVVGGVAIDASRVPQVIADGRPALLQPGPIDL